VELSAVPFRFDGERGAMVLVRDVTERRASMNRLAEQIALIEGILRSTPDAVYVKDREGRYRLINPPMEAVLGLASGVVLGSGDEALFPPEVADRIRADDRRVMESGQAEVFEEALPTPEGARLFLTSKSPLRSPEGAVMGVVGVARDIRDRKRMEDALRESEAKFATFMAHLPGLACIQDPEARFIFVNSAFEQCFGLRPGEALGRAPEVLLPVGVASCFRRGVAEVVDSGRLREREEEFEHRDGGRTHLLSQFPIRRPDGGLVVGSFSVDITDRKRAEEAVHGLTGRLLNSQDEERRRLARELHDTTAQDLTAIGLGLTRVLQLLPAEGPESVRMLVNDCMGLVEHSGRDVRTLSYLLHPPLLDEMGLPAALREFVGGLMRRSGMRIDLDCPEEFGRVGREREMALFRIAQESLANARRHAAGGAVRVELRREAGEILLEVSDDGAASAEPDRLQSLRQGSGSMGVGVLGMQERVRQLGGEARVESIRGRTAVRARLPAGEALKVGRSS
jgi:PAS domain S-box-containing protein